jgi:cytochrome P450
MLVWTFFVLCQHPEFQTKLREEVSGVATDDPTYDELNNLQYLDAVVRECLRLHPSVGGIPRVAAEDTFLPLAQPFTDTAGKVHDKLL